MNYPTRCTHCISLLKNCKAFQNAHFYMNMNEVYIDVEDYILAENIAILQALQEETFKQYNNIVNQTEKEA